MSKTAKTACAVIDTVKTDSDEKIQRMLEGQSIKADEKIEFYAGAAAEKIREMERAVFFAARDAGVLNSPKKNEIIAALRKSHQQLSD